MATEREVRLAVREVLSEEAGRAPAEIKDTDRVRDLLSGDSARVARTTSRLRGYIKFRNPEGGPDATLLQQEVARANLTVRQLVELVHGRTEMGWCEKHGHYTTLPCEEP